MVKFQDHRVAHETTQRKEVLNKGMIVTKLLWWLQAKDLFLINTVKVLEKCLLNHIQKMNTMSKYNNKLIKKVKTREWIIKQNNNKYTITDLL